MFFLKKKASMEGVFFVYHGLRSVCWVMVGRDYQFNALLTVNCHSLLVIVCSFVYFWIK